MRVCLKLNQKSSKQANGSWGGGLISTPAHNFVWRHTELAVRQIRDHVRGRANRTGALSINLPLRLASRLCAWGALPVSGRPRRQRSPTRTNGAPRNPKRGNTKRGRQSISDKRRPNGHRQLVITLVIVAEASRLARRLKLACRLGDVCPEASSGFPARRLVELYCCW